MKRPGLFLAAMLTFCGGGFLGGEIAPARAEETGTLRSELIPQNEILVQNQGAGDSLPVTYNVRISKETDRIKLKGSMSSEEDYKTLIGLVKASFPSADLTDRVKVREQAAVSEVKVGGLSFALKLLGYLESGQASVDNNGLAIEGAASNGAVLSEVREFIERDKPTGVALRNIRIAPPARVWAATISPDATLRISGVMPDESGKNKIAAAARRAFSECEITNNTAVNASVPDRWTKAGLHALKLLRLLNRGTVEVTDQTIQLKGDAPSETALQSIDLLASEFPSGFALKSEVTAPMRPGVAAIPPDETLH
ncbi:MULTISPECIES: hypothetical protein [Rhodomicrobium]|uniref:hypothetical protein n=1 Tax=Rhodomicrobium TaxID=1068 RepID=UPI000F73DE31|nr:MULTISPECIES: hypothetical protein [Rhodomicrobium]